MKSADNVTCTYVVLLSMCHSKFLVLGMGYEIFLKKNLGYVQNVNINLKNTYIKTFYKHDEIV